jgi:hypothetical protein
VEAGGRAGRPPVARRETEVFAELETLCQSPGYARLIARMCLLDSMISYAGEAASV